MAVVLDTDNACRTYRCSGCQESLPAEAYHNDSKNARHGRRDGLNYYCKGCVRARYRRKSDDPVERERLRENQNARRRRDPERYLEWKYRSQFGIGVEDYDRILAEQGGVCAICKTDKPSGGKARFSVDHCHETGKVRGLLCNLCTAGIGFLKDDVAVLVAATQYLERALADG